MHDMGVAQVNQWSPWLMHQQYCFSAQHVSDRDWCQQVLVPVVGEHIS